MIGKFINRQGNFKNNLIINLKLISLLINKPTTIEGLATALHWAQTILQLRIR